MPSKRTANYVDTCVFSVTPLELPLSALCKEVFQRTLGNKKVNRAGPALPGRAKKSTGESFRQARWTNRSPAWPLSGSVCLETSQLITKLAMQWQTECSQGASLQDVAPKVLLVFGIFILSASSCSGSERGLLLKCWLQWVQEEAVRVTKMGRFAQTPGHPHHVKHPDRWEA